MHAFTRLFFTAQLLTRGSALLAELPRVPGLQTEGACDIGAEQFNRELCNLAAVGVKDPVELLRPTARPRMLAELPQTDDASRPTTCRQRFYPMPYEEAESYAPGLKPCLVSTFAAEVHKGFTAGECTTKNVSEADIVLLPGYTAVECNWPIYGSGNCYEKGNFARMGAKCRSNATIQDYLAIRAATGKKLMVFEMSDSFWLYDLPDKRVYTDPNIVWALVGSDRWHYRAGHDISAPVGPTYRCKQPFESANSGLGRRMNMALSQRLEDKRWLASFKGNLDIIKWRRHAASLLHNEKDVIVVHTTEKAYDFDDLLVNSTFNLILRGDTLMSYRFNEAVCSGNVPVFINDFWIPPLNELVPIEEYAVHMNLTDADLRSVRDRLLAIDIPTRERLRRRAREVCEKHLQTIARQTWSMSHIIGQGIVT